jgi:hypothetical protein
LAFRVSHTGGGASMTIAAITSDPINLPVYCYHLLPQHPIPIPNIQSLLQVLQPHHPILLHVNPYEVIFAYHLPHQTRAPPAKQHRLKFRTPIMVCGKCQKKLKKTELATPGVKRKNDIYYGSPSSTLGGGGDAKSKPTLGNTGISKVS